VWFDCQKQSGWHAKQHNSFAIDILKAFWETELHEKLNYCGSMMPLCLSPMGQDARVICKRDI
jgi:hypothetical protein